MAKKREHEHPDERWLVSYADMITVLMALFIVLFSISVVNQGKFDELARSLKKSFSGAVIDGGSSVLTFGSSSVTANTRKSASNASEQPVPQQAANQSEQQQAEVTRELQQALKRAGVLEAAQDESLRAAQQQIDQTARQLGVADKVQTQINERGLVIRLVTDDLLFDIGSSTVRPAAIPLLTAIATAIEPIKNPMRIEGHTDAIPFAGDPLGNVALSTDRAVSVLRTLVASGLDRASHPDLAPSGFGEMRPLVPNAPDGSGPRNRRVEIVVLRQNFVEDTKRAAAGPIGVNPAGLEPVAPDVTAAG